MLNQLWLSVSCKPMESLLRNCLSTVARAINRSRVYWTGVFKQWAVTRRKKEEIESYEVSQLNEFFAELRMENGTEYKPDSLKVMCVSLDRFLRSKIYPTCRKRCTVPFVKKSGGIERASSRRHRFPQKFCPSCDKQVILSVLGQLRISFTCMFKVFPTDCCRRFANRAMREKFKNTREINP